MTNNIFFDAADLIEAGWCQGTSATDADGNKVRWESPTACRFCILGALSRALGTNWSQQAFSEAQLAVQRQLREMGSSTISLPGWNDRTERTRAEVVELLRQVGRNV